MSFDREQERYRCIPCAFGAPSTQTQTQPTPVQEPEPTQERPLGEIPLAQLEVEFQKRKYLGRKVVLANCAGCGSQVEATAADFVSECLYCGKKTTISEETQLSSQYQAVVPFKVSLQAATESIKRFLGSRKFGSVVSASQVENKVRKLYVPFWCYDIDVKTVWEGNTSKQLTPNLFEKLVGSEGRRQQMNLTGDRAGHYNDLLVCGSRSIPNELVRSIEPFSTEGAEWGKGLEDPSLIIERVAESPKGAWLRGKKEVLAREYDVCVGMADNAALVHKGDLPRITGQVHFGEVRSKAALLPFYLFYQDTTKGPCIVVVNGETGKVNGKVPDKIDRTIVLLATGFLLTMINNKYLSALFDRHFGKKALEDEILELQEMVEEKSKMLHAVEG